MLQRKMVNIGYYKKINEAYYETIKEKFDHLECSISDKTGYLSFYYFVNDNCDKTIEEARMEMNQIEKKFFKSKYFKNFVKISNEDYINMITVLLFLPSDIIEKELQ